MASGVLAAVAGALLAPVINPAPDVGIFPAVKSYVIVVIGGMGSIPGSILAALLLGVLESFAAVYLRSEEHTSELQSLMRISYAVFCLKKKNNSRDNSTTHS